MRGVANATRREYVKRDIAPHITLRPSALGGTPSGRNTDG